MRWKKEVGEDGTRASKCSSASVETPGVLELVKEERASSSDETG